MQHSRKILVVGAGSYIAQAVVERLAVDGYAVTVGGIEDSADIALDVTDAASCARAVETVGPQLCGAVNLASYSCRNNFVGGSADAAHRTLDVALFGTWNVTAALGRFAHTAQTKVSLVNVSSINAHFPVPGFSAYGAAKAGVDYLTRVAAVELAPWVRVNAVAPGPVYRPRPIYEAFPAMLDPIKERHPLEKRLTERRDVADVVSLLLDPRAAWVTGQVVAVDGGVALNYGTAIDPNQLADALEGDPQES